MGLLLSWLWSNVAASRGWRGNEGVRFGYGNGPMDIVDIGIPIHMVHIPIPPVLSHSCRILMISRPAVATEV